MNTRTFLPRFVQCQLGAYKTNIAWKTVEVENSLLTEKSLSNKPLKQPFDINILHSVENSQKSFVNKFLIATSEAYKAGVRVCFENFYNKVWKTIKDVSQFYLQECHFAE